MASFDEKSIFNKVDTEDEALEKLNNELAEEEVIEEELVPMDDF